MDGTFTDQGHNLKAVLADAASTIAAEHNSLMALLRQVKPKQNALVNC